MCAKTHQKQTAAQLAAKRKGREAALCICVLTQRQQFPSQIPHALSLLSCVAFCCMCVCVWPLLRTVEKISATYWQLLWVLLELQEVF